MASFISAIDEAMKTLVFTKFQTLLFLTGQVTGIEFAPKEIAQRRNAEKKGKVPMEFVSIWREPPEFDWRRQRTPVARRGFQMGYVDGEGNTNSINIKAVPATLEYNIYFWTLKFETINQIAEACLFWIHNNPELAIYFNTSYLMNLDLNFGRLVDESPLDQAYNIGQYHVYRLPIRLEGWVFSQSTIKTILEIIMKVYYNETLETATPENSELLGEYSITESDES